MSFVYVHDQYSFCSNCLDSIDNWNNAYQLIGNQVKNTETEIPTYKLLLPFNVSYSSLDCVTQKHPLIFTKNCAFPVSQLVSHVEIFLERRK